MASRVDESLARDWASGRREVLERIYKLYHDDLYDFFLHVVGDPRAAARLFQDLFARIESALGNPIPAPYDVTTLIYAWARTAALEYLQQQGWLNALPADVSPLLAPGVTQDIWNAARELNGVHRATLAVANQSALNADQQAVALGYAPARFVQLLQSAQHSLAQRFDERARAEGRPTSAQITAQPERFGLRKRHALAGGLFAFLPLATVPPTLDAALKSRLSEAGGQAALPVPQPGTPVAVSPPAAGITSKQVAIIGGLFLAVLVIFGIAAVFILQQRTLVPRLSPNSSKLIYVETSALAAEPFEYLLVNEGDAPLRIHDARADNAVFRITSALPIEIPPRSSDRLRGEFVPFAAGEHRGNLILATNDPQANPFRISLHGRASETIGEWVPSATPTDLVTPIPPTPDLRYVEQTRVLSESSATLTLTPTRLDTPTSTPTRPVMLTSTLTTTATQAATRTPTPSRTVTWTTTPSRTPTWTLTPTRTLTPSRTPTPTTTRTRTRTPTPTPDTVGPPAPNIIGPKSNVELACSANVLLDWTAPYDPSGIQNYRVRLQKRAGADYVDLQIWDPVTATSVNANAPTHCGEFYRWRLFARDGAGNQGQVSDWAYFAIKMP